MEDPTSRYTTPDARRDSGDAARHPSRQPRRRHLSRRRRPRRRRPARHPDRRPPLPHPPPPQPAWRPPPADHGRTVSLIFGVIILLVGLWFFASRTLGLDMPDLEWGQLWPLLLIGLGAWIVYGAMRRNR